MIYEYRIYRCLPGRLPALLKRFENHTTKIWEKHGIKQAGFWTVLIGDGNHDLHYFLAWESLADREQKWAKFQADPAWISARADSETRWADRRQHHQHADDADGLLVGEVTIAEGRESDTARDPGHSLARGPGRRSVVGFSRWKL